ncbi:Belongs to the helicase [Dionaea muscipula]
MTSICLLISMAASCHWPLHQLNVKNSFLHGDLAEEVYMEQPPGFVAQGECDCVCRLKKSLYELRQSLRAWFGRFNSVVLEFRLHQSVKDPSVFYRTSSDGCIFLVVYVDDIVITGSDNARITLLKTFLHSHFQTKDLGSLRYFLGIEVSRCKREIFLSQRKYALDLLRDTGMLDCMPRDTPMLPELRLLSAEGAVLDDSNRYRRLVGKLNYLAITRLDIAFSVSVLSQFMSDPRVPHWEAVVHILQYIKGYPSRGLLYSDHGHRRIERFSDADWAGSPSDRKSTIGYCVFVGGNLVSWKCKKQTVVARSSAESEYRALSHLTGEVTFLIQLLNELEHPAPKPAELWCDSMYAIHIASNPVFHETTKHIEVDCHFVREKLQSNDIVLHHVKTGEQLADVLTKSLFGNRVEYICNKLGMVNIYAPT